MKTFHNAFLGEYKRQRPCDNCGQGYAPEAQFCDQIVHIFSRPFDKYQEDRYVMLKTPDNHCQIYFNGNPVYQGATDQEATEYFKHIFTLDMRA